MDFQYQPTEIGVIFLAFLGLLKLVVEIWNAWAVRQGKKDDPLTTLVDLLKTMTSEVKEIRSEVNDLHAWHNIADPNEPTAMNWHNTQYDRQKVAEISAKSDRILASHADTRQVVDAMNQDLSRVLNELVALRESIDRREHAR